MQSKLFRPTFFLHATQTHGPAAACRAMHDVPTPLAAIILAAREASVDVVLRDAVGGDPVGAIVGQRLCPATPARSFPLGRVVLPLWHGGTITSVCGVRLCDSRGTLYRVRTPYGEVELRADEMLDLPGATVPVDEPPQESDSVITVGGAEVSSMLGEGKRIAHIWLREAWAPDGSERPPWPRCVHGKEHRIRNAVERDHGVWVKPLLPDAWHDKGDGVVFQSVELLAAQPTHRVMFYESPLKPDEDPPSAFCDVMLWSDGSAYIRDDWERDCPAAWTYSGGMWRYRGLTTPCGVLGVLRVMPVGLLKFLRFSASS